MEINKNYSPQAIEKKWYKHWIENNCFAPSKNSELPPYTVLIPPPNVTGILHMGHVLNNTIQDVSVRFKRMCGYPTLWIPGVDHAGIATQNVVERQLAQEGKNRYDIGRENLIEKIWEWKHEKGGRIIEQLKQLGASCDWNRQRFTMDEGLSKAVKEVFVKLYEKDLIYKGKYIINWCPHDKTALANDEVDHEDEKGKLWHIKYPYADGTGFVVVATTRPETMFGDVAVAVNPNDERYKNLIGKKLILPLTEKEIPVIADDYVDLEFGSGCVKITPAHDPNDFEVGQRHNLEQVVVMNEGAIMNENAPKDFIGLTREEARKKAIELLAEQNLLEKIEDHEHAVGHCYRCGTVIEPYLSDQWFVKMKPLAEKAIEVVKSGEIKFQPQRWEKVYLHWMENIRDWCISRQIWWGHRVPAFYCQDCGEVIVATEEPTKCTKCSSANLKQDEDVLDTWFSSWLWPFSTLGWPEQTEDLNYFLPTNLLVTAPGIIYLWVARMIMATLEFTGKIPFDTIYLHGMVLDEKGRKMSKSLGNSPDPIHIIEEYGADALRFGMIFNTPKGADSYYSNGNLEGGRNFANKIWNAFRFIMMNAEKIEGLPKFEELKLELADKWIYSRLNQVTEKVTELYESLRFNDAAQLLMDFVWKEFCSWYLELSKDRIYNEEDKQGQLTAKYILLDVLQKSMKLLHPIMPFITEEIYQVIKTEMNLDEENIVTAKFPKTNPDFIDEKINEEMDFVQNVISAVRNLRKENSFAPAEEIKIMVQGQTYEQKNILTQYANYLAKLAKVDNTVFVDEAELANSKPFVAAAILNAKIAIPVAGLKGVDISARITRVKKDLAKLEKDLARTKGKLSNQKFVNSAPAAVVEKEKEKLAEIEQAFNKNKEVLLGLE